MPVYRKDGRSVLFVHVPKTGGTSVEHLFRANGWEQGFFSAKYGKGTLNHLMYCGPQHLHAEPLEQLFRLERFDLIFTVVREPVARLRSEYVWRHRKKEQVDLGARAVSAWFASSVKRFRANPYLYDNHLRPQHEFLLPGSEVIRLEDGLAEGLRRLSDAHDLGLEGGPEQFKDSSSGPRRSGDVEISAATKRRIRRFYKRDASTFDYPRP